MVGTFNQSVPTIDPTIDPPWSSSNRLLAPKGQAVAQATPFNFQPRAPWGVWHWGRQSCMNVPLTACSPQYHRRPPLPPPPVATPKETIEPCIGPCAPPVRRQFRESPFVVRSEHLKFNNAKQSKSEPNGPIPKPNPQSSCGMSPHPVPCLVPGHGHSNHQNVNDAKTTLGLSVISFGAGLAASRTPLFSPSIRAVLPPAPGAAVPTRNKVPTTPGVASIEQT